jgi:hypothetical protein
MTMPKGFGSVEEEEEVGKKIVKYIVPTADCVVSQS